MEFGDVVRRRRMVRNYDPDRPVPPEVRERLLEHAIHAPSAGFSQGWGFLVLESPDERGRFWRAATPETDVWQQWLVNMRTAPLIIVPHSNKDVYLDRYAQPDKGWTDRAESRWPVPFWHIDTGMAALLILLTVVDEGLGALYFGIVPEAVGRFRAAFGVPDDHEPIGAIAIGYDAENEKRDLRARRRPLGDLVHYGRW
jgi:nitroreductase